MAAGPTWPTVLTAVLSGRDLAPSEATWAWRRIMNGEASPAQLAAFVVALRAKGVTVDELTAIAEEMLAHARPIVVPGPTLDIVGTGGDGSHSVNISTMAALVCAGAGATVVKHGNRAASSSSGTADVLEELGVVLDLSPDQVAEVARTAGMTFCFAQVFHPAMRHAAGPRRDLGIPTVFNILGPLTNPARPSHAAIGVADPALAPLVAGVFAARGKDTAVLRGDDGLDELTISTTSRVWWVRGGSVREYVVDPETLGVPVSPLSSLRGGSPAENAQVVREVLSGRVGPIRDAVVLNAGLALAVMGPSSGSDQGAFVRDLRQGMDRAEASIDTGSAADSLERWRSATCGYRAG
ncbi:anthranilate phosphoribosyltransferase [Austwickia chelonae]|uniref:Anthranilate phosphoribosyltransferase n=1 Tax=Austwickia chelonae NBRC 105200 TaxID=1184607 RepID=K6VLN0_9MICO|nr:anthranilate phosphoribosyltransferase [Austwickia chelonae]GAB77634.1 anthranilate phosphoribosyltransferase [Austwickia chelonae NBRC 105200]SEW14592.1 anthranilate phosphoribosyltransferase [Austwickia chelonae]